MNAAGRLGLYGAGLAVAFAAAFGVAALVVPDSAVAEWTESAQESDEHSGMETSETEETEVLPGLSLSAYGYALSTVDAPTAIGEEGTLSFQILDAAGDPLTAFKTEHDKELHLIVVRTDGTGFRHVHPTLDADSGTWSVPWTWDAAGTYRVYADFVPDVEDGPDKVTLTRAIDIAGDVTPEPATETSTTDEVDGFEVSIDGTLTAGSSSDLTITVSRDGEPVTTLEPYLGAFGHLVTLREGDLAYLHVHPLGDEPEAGDTGGPEIEFAAEAPTAGRYLLYLDFQVDGQVHTAEFVLDAVHGDGTSGETHDDSDTDDH
ncbi:MAG: heavy-metal-associated domain-containing protein [Microbacterium sp.]